jgi:predicted alpha/beta-fold hydrolase
MRPFAPLFRNPHVLTVLGNFWPRGYDFTPYPLENHLIQTDPDTQVLVQTQYPQRTQERPEPVGEVVLLHGLEGSGEAGYIKSMAWDLLEAGFIAHRFHMRTCGNTEHLCKTLYHAGLTSDLRAFLEQLRAERRRDIPILICGFSLGGNVALKLAGEVGETDLIQGVCAVSTPIDLAMGVERIGKRDNRLYEQRFLARMRERLAATGRYAEAELAQCRTIYEIDDRVTAPSFGFGNADNYYATQSAQNFLAAIRVPTLMVQAKDDTFIPFAMYERPEIWTNTHLHLIATEHGGHLGYLSRRSPRFWVDEVAIGFMRQAVMQANSVVGR